MICVVSTLQFIYLLPVFVSAVLKFVRGEDPIGLEIQRWGVVSVKQEYGLEIQRWGVVSVKQE